MTKILNRMKTAHDYFTLNIEFGRGALYNYRERQTAGFTVSDAAG